MQLIDKLNETHLDDGERKQYKIVPVIIAEDISVAFEGINHITITRCVERLRQLNHYTPDTYNKLEV